MLQVGIYQVLYLNRTPDEAYAPLAPKGPYMPFRDASCGIPTFNLQPIDCIRVRTSKWEQRLGVYIVQYMDSSGSRSGSRMAAGCQTRRSSSSPVSALGVICSMRIASTSQHCASIGGMSCQDTNNLASLCWASGRLAYPECDMSWCT